MEEWFYTDAARTQQGPVARDTLLSLNRNGDINADSLVWKEGMPDWLPFAQVAGPMFGETEEGIPMETGVCAHSKRVYPISEMLPYGDALIGIEHKDAFIQHLMESGNTQIADATDSRFIYVGFWWRTLSSFLDYLAKIVPSYLCMIPYYIAAVATGMQSENNPKSLGGMTVVMAIAYAVGILGMLGISIFYETWMVGKYGGTLGKMAIGARIVNPDGSKLTYGRAFVRWLAKKPLNGLIVYVPPTIVLMLFFGVGFSAIEGKSNSALGVSSIFGGLIAFVLVAALFSGVYWMCAFDPEKRTLHDRICATRVVRK